MSKQDVNKLLTIFFITCNIPFKTVENIHFHKLVNTFCSINFTYKLPVRQTLANSFITNLHQDIIERRKKILENTFSVLLVDGWKNAVVNRKYLVFTVKNINTPQIFLKFIDISMDSEDGEFLSNAINEAVKEAKEKYKTDIYAIISNNDSKIKSGGRLAESYDNTPLWQTTCSSHSGNLLLKIVVENDFVETIREIIMTFRTPKLESLLIKRGETKLQNYPNTRFCFFKYSCESVLKNLLILRRISMIEDVDVNDNIMTIIHDVDFQTRLVRTIDDIEPLCTLINKCQNPNCNIADATQMWLCLAASNKYDTDLVKSRIQKAVWPIGYAANIMNPKYQVTMLDENSREKAFNFCHEHFSAEALVELDNFMNNPPNEIESFMNRCKNPVTFWSLCSDFYPHLSEFAIKLNIIPASTAQLESLFSHWTYIHNSYRKRLSAITSGKLIDIYYSILHEKNL